jgi:hypothetical protein
MRIQVMCTESADGRSEPRVLTLGDRPVAVAEVLDRWHGPDHRYVKVRGEDGATYILRESLGDGSWTLTFYTLVS